METGELDLTKYLDRFPASFREFIKNESNRKAFLEYVKWDYQPLKVYRFVHSCKNVVEHDFLNNIDEAQTFSLSRPVPNTLESYAVSVNESFEALKKSLKFPNKYKSYYGIAVGEMNCKYGPANFDEDRPHHNWYIFNDSVKEIIGSFEICFGEEFYAK